MKKTIITSLMFVLSFLPLSVIRVLGSVVGIVALKISKRTANRLKNNLLKSSIATTENVEVLARQSAKEMGKTLVESALLGWTRNQNLDDLFEVDNSFDKVFELKKQGKKLLFLTPHIGNFEVAMKFYGKYLPIDICYLYKPTKDKDFNQIMLDGRKAINMHPEPTTRKGVLAMMKHYQNGGDIGILPDNVASGGNGEWVKFFGQYVYAATLTAKLCKNHDTSTVLVQSLRTKTGFRSRCIIFEPKATDIKSITQELYHEIEKMVMDAPTQYYWSYDRYRNVGHAKPKPTND